MTRRGWPNHSREHALAARGIRCRAGGMVEDRVRFPESSVSRDYESRREYIQELMVAFWVASLDNDFSRFDFQQWFDIGRGMLDADLMIQARMSAEDIIAIAEEAEEAGWDELPGDLMWKDVAAAEFYLRLKNPPKRLSEKIVLADELIDYEHLTGGLWDVYDIDIEGLREKTERAYKRYRR